MLQRAATAMESLISDFFDPAAGEALRAVPSWEATALALQIDGLQPEAKRTVKKLVAQLTIGQS